MPARLMPEPSFVLSGPDRTLVADGIHTPYPEVAAARAALASGAAPMVLGALPFDLTRPAALMRPEAFRFVDALPVGPVTELPRVRVDGELPSPEVHRARICEALGRLNDPRSALHKVVLARALRLVADQPLDVTAVMRRLAEDPTAIVYFADLTPAGGRHVGSGLIGASPELLVARRGDVVTCRPFAGSAARSPDPAIDRANGAALAASAKNRHEHQLVVDQMRDALAPLCTDLRIAAEPQLSSTAAVWHLNTPISGRIRQSSTTALDLAIALHPTPAVGGVPAAAATDLINELEGDRGFYAGAVGWCDDSGDGTWVVSIRCAELSADRRTADARAGGGIVAESDPDEEVAETSTKFKTITTALGVRP
jgi:isochorismate synthase